MTRGTKIVAGVVAVAGLICVALLDDSKPYTPPAELSATEVSRVPVGDAMDRLEEDDRPFTVAIIGDSTGASGKGWQVRLGKWISDTYDRPVTLHPWAVEVDPNGYQETWGLGDGKGAPVTIWNGSASGQNIAYSVEHLDELVPAEAGDPDLILFNHGHNVVADGWTTAAPALLVDLAEAHPDAAFAVMLQNPEVEPSLHVDVQREVVEDARGWADDHDVAAVDVWSRFEDAGNVARLIDDTGYHPTPKGYRLWADEVIDVLGSS